MVDDLPESVAGCGVRPESPLPPSHGHHCGPCQVAPQTCENKEAFPGNYVRALKFFFGWILSWITSRPGPLKYHTIRIVRLKFVLHCTQHHRLALHSASAGQAGEPGREERNITVPPSQAGKALTATSHRHGHSWWTWWFQLQVEVYPVTAEAGSVAAYRRFWWAGPRARNGAGPRRRWQPWWFLLLDNNRFSPDKAHLFIPHHHALKVLENIRRKMLKKLENMRNIFLLTNWRKYEAFLVFILATSIYLNSLYGEFLFDDIVAVSIIFINTMDGIMI